MAGNNVLNVEKEKDKNKDEATSNSEIRKNITVRGLSGLKNQGNTCYMNAGLQCISATNIFTAYFLDKKFVKTLDYNIQQNLASVERKRQKLPKDSDVELNTADITKTAKRSVTYGYYKLMKLMWSDNLVITPEQFKAILGYHNPIFKGYGQQDSQEMINCVLDTIHEELKTPVTVNYVNLPTELIEFRTEIKKIQKQLKAASEPDDKIQVITKYRNYLNSHMEEYTVNSSLDYWEKYIKNSHSIIRDIFTGMTCTATKCNECQITSLAFEPFIMLPISIPDQLQAIKLTECLKHYSVTNNLVGKDKYKCDNCNEYRDAIQNTYLWESPEILIIHLKRFSSKVYGNGYCRTEKISTMVEYPIKDMDLSDMYSPYNNHDDKYELFGVVQQFGSLNGGHYTACCKNAMNDRWYNFDDSHVTCIPDANIEEEVVCKSAYILFYRKQHTTVDFDEAD